MTQSRARVGRGRATIAGTAVGFAVLVTACTGDGTSGPTASPSAEPGETAHATAQAFLQAQADGQYSAAVEMSTKAPADFACEWLTSEQPGRSVVAQVEAVDIDPSGDSATATVSPQAQSNRVASLDLVGGDGAWLVEWPEPFHITATFSELAVAELRLEDAAIGDDDCSVPASDGSMTMEVFPGAYVATVVDPTGVVDYSLGSNIRVTGADSEVWDLGEAVPEAQLTALQVEFADVRQAGRVQCDGGLCPEEVMGDDGQILPGSLTRVWTDDGESWNCDVDFGGQVFTGTLERSTAGDLSVNLTSTD